MKENIGFLESLLKTASPSGMEENAASLFVNQCVSQGCTYEFTDKINNSVVSKGNGATTVMISGHIDTLGLIITTITDDGFLHFMRNSGEDKKVIPGQRFEIILDSGATIPAVCMKKAIHLETSKERDTVEKVEDMVLSIGAHDKKAAEALGIRTGLLCVYKMGNEILEFGPEKDLICSESLDDKIGVYITAEVMRRLRNIPGNIKVLGAATTQEETGLRGAGILANKLNPSVSIDIDVTHSTESSLGINKDKVGGDIKLGSGVVIEFGADKSRRIGKKMIDICKASNIPYQLSAGIACGTNTSNIQERALDCETMLLSIPCQNMHTPVEVVSWVDVEACINLIVKFIEG